MQRINEAIKFALDKHTFHNKKDGGVPQPLKWHGFLSFDRGHFLSIQFYKSKSFNLPDSYKQFGETVINSLKNYEIH